ncbi:MAG: protease-4 [Brevundimonas sp.]|jgi:protease-4|uniref:signal peptide peptidase SppA n=1 Tax=Brevundimonas sp. TaxID=1871086 RepID=UPI0039E49BDA
MKQFALTIAGVFVGLLLFFIGIPLLLIASAAGSSKPAVHAQSVLEVDLRGGLTDQAPTNPFAGFGGSGLSVMRVVDVLAQAQEDDRIKVVLVRLPESGMTPASADELRQAIRRFRASGKPVIAHSQGLMPLGAVVSTYMLGASADEFWMQENASFQATGLASEEIFFGRAFERYGVTADFEQRYEYKNAVNTFTQSDFTEAHREAAEGWMTSIYVNALANAARDRDMEAAALRTAFESGPHTPAEAEALGLIDHTGGVHEAEAEARRRAGDNGRIIRFSDYSAAVGERTGSGRNAIAIVGGEGAILTGRSSADPFGAGSMMSSDDIAAAIYDAIEEDSVRAIVFRVSSPGGSPEGSEQILEAVRAAKAAGKPVVVSMGAYAASGGYWISSEASAIVAQPSTLTGSIGVYGGKFVLDEALGRFGVDIQGLTVGGEYADAFTPERPFNEAERAAFSGWMDGVYEDFIARVSTGRDLPAARVREIARGRVWTGAQARQLGLVDEIGGIHEAIQRAKALAEIPEDESVRFRRYPRPLSTWEALGEAFGASGEAAETLIRLNGVMSDPDVQAVVARARAERMRSQGAVVMADQPLR